MQLPQRRKKEIAKVRTKYFMEAESLHADTGLKRYIKIDTPKSN